jgi:hypothetical protein
MDYMIYCKWFWGNDTLVVVIEPSRSLFRLFGSLLEENTMILFIAKTWFLWWIFAVVFIVRWFHVVSARATTENFNTVASDREQAQTICAQLEGASALGRTA